MMEHDHGRHTEKRIASAFFINFFFTIFEVIGGLYTNSLAILSDALHDLGDSLSLGLAWYFERISKKGRTDDYSYGYRRFSLLGALINALVLIIGSIAILSEAIPALWSPGEADPKGMVIISVFGVIFNTIAFFKLGHSHSMNEKVVKWHLLEDVLGWVAVLIGSIVMYFTDIMFIDPLLSVLISLFIIYNVIRNLKKSLSIFLQATPEGLDVEDIENRILAIEDIDELHDCHAWSMDGNFNIFTVHLVIDGKADLKKQYDIKKKVKDAISDLPVHHLTIEFEARDENCLQDDL